jgi:hypothetical protein
LIFPEGTRSDTGVMTDFKPSLGYLALTNKCGILPMYLAGTYDAMPKGRYLPHAGAEVAAHLGPFLSYEQLVAMSEGRTRAESYRQISWHVEGIVRKLAPKQLAWTLGESGTTPLAMWQGGAVEAEADADEAPATSAAPAHHAPSPRKSDEVTP